ncbi:MAG: hypothetical protein K2J10_02380, partial [Muribaculaceae bacterium]|nr:hypothetical protein [Muribaculaceae bacterium]
MAKRRKDSGDGFDPIRSLIENNVISHKEITELAKIDYPLFSFRYFRPNSIKKCNNADFFMGFLNRLRELSEKGWSEIRRSRKHEYGLEPIPKFKIKPDLKCVSDLITDDVEKLHVFRVDKEN